jgi:hypothetical protein
MKQTTAFNDAGEPACSECYLKHLRPKEKCSVCGEKKTVPYRSPAGDPICRRCYCQRVHQENCAICGRLRGVSKRREDGGAICNTCYTRERRRGTL